MSSLLFKGTVARDFRPLVFFVNQPHMDSRCTLYELFSKSVWTSRRFEKVLSSGLSETALNNKTVKLGNHFFHFSVLLGLYSTCPEYVFFLKKYLEN